MSDEKIIGKHGGYANTKTFQLAEVIYDVTVLFCDKYVDRFSRTKEQMVQAARSGRQNLAEGSVDSAISQKSEMKLTGIAKGSLVELKLDYEDYLRQRGLPLWSHRHPALQRFKQLRCANLQAFRQWVAREVRGEKSTDGHGHATDSHVSVGASPCQSVIPSPPSPPNVCAANGALSLLNLCIHLIGKQMEAQAEAFKTEGGFAERLYRVRSNHRRRPL